MNEANKICIVGTGYVGLASAIGLSRLGHRVVGYDIIRERVRSLSEGVTPYNEPGIAEALAQELRSGRLHFVEDLSDAVAGADFVIVAVSTPSNPDGSADLSYLDAAITALAICVGPTTIVIRSTVPVGTTELVARALRGRAHVVYAPEFLSEGRAVADFLNPDRIVVGAASKPEAAAYAELFTAIDCPRVVTSYRNAELIKAFSNAFLATKISFANEVANFCDAVDADALEVLRAVGLDRRIGKHFLHPGIGFGGPCFEKDIRSLLHQAGRHGVNHDVLGATLATNNRQPGRVRDILEQELGSVHDKTLGVWGLTFKAGTDDVRDSLALRVVDDLMDAGAHVRAYDPSITGTLVLARCNIVSSAIEAIDNADALVVLTDWQEFTMVDLVTVADRMRTALVVDGRNLLEPELVVASGLQYRGIGRRGGSASSIGRLRATDADGTVAV